MKPKKYELSNGLTVVLAERRHAPVVAFQVWVKVGSGDELPGEYGLAHVFEHMLFKGTKRRPVGQIPQDVERAGGQINAWTSPDETVFHITMASRFAERGLDILSDAIRNASLDEQELANELPVVLEEIRMGEDSPERNLVQSLFKTSFRKHPYGRPVIGFEKTVRQFRRPLVSSFHKRWYVPNNMVLVVCGDFDSTKMMASVESAFGDMKSKRLPVRSMRTQEPTARKIRVDSLSMPIGEAHLAIGFPVGGLLNEDTPALDMLASVLGQGASSRLELGLRRGKGLVSEIRAMAYTPVDAGLLSVISILPQERLKASLGAIYDELNRLTNTPIDPSELEKARTMIESESVYSEESVEGLARKLGYYQLHTGMADFENQYLYQISQLDPSDLLDVAQKYLIADRSRIAVVVPDPKYRAPRGRVPWVSGPAKSKKLDHKTLRNELTQSAKQPKVKKPVAKSTRTSPLHTDLVELPDGDVLLVRPDPASRVVAVRASFHGGLRFQKPSESGVAMMTANCLTRGTHRRSGEEIAGIMDSLACSVGGFAGRNTIGVSGEFISRNFVPGFSLFSEVLQEASFPPDEVDREKQLQIEEIRAAADNPSFQLFRLFQNELFGRHPYGTSLLGEENGVAELQAKDLSKYFTRCLSGSPMVIGIVGGTSTAEAHALIESTLLPIRRAARKKQGNPPQAPARKKPVQVSLDLPKEQSHVVLGFPGITLDDPDRFALEVLIEILGGHGGRLFSSVREKLGLAYSVTALSTEGIEPGYAAFYAATSPGNEERVVQAMTDEIKKICDKHPKRDELSRVKSHLCGVKAIHHQRSSSRAAYLSLDYLYGLGWDASDKYTANIESVKATDVERVANRLFDLDRRIVSCVGPDVSQLTFV